MRAQGRHAAGRPGRFPLGDRDDVLAFERSGGLRRPPRALGNRRHKPLAAAPGSYVHAG